MLLNKKDEANISLKGTFFQDFDFERLEGIEVRSHNFGKAKNLKIRDLLKMTPDEEVQRVLDFPSVLTRLSKKFHKEPGFYGELCNAISIFYKKENGIKAGKFTNGQHTAVMLVGLAHLGELSWDQEVPVVVYDLSPEMSAIKFNSDNGQSIKVLKSEECFPAEIKYDFEPAVRLMNILDKAKLRFKDLDTFRSSKNPVKCLSKHKEIVKRSEIERCIKSDTSANKENFLNAIKLIRDNYDAKKDGSRSSLLISALTFILSRFEYINEKPQPHSSFVNWFNSQCKATDKEGDRTKPNESSWTGDSIDGQGARAKSIGYRIMKEFLIDPDNGLSKEDLIILSGEFLRKIELSFDNIRHLDWVDRQTASVKELLK